MILTPEEHKALIAERRAAGVSYRRIASELGCHNVTVKKFVEEHLPDLVSNALNGHDRTRKASLPPTPSELELLRAEVKELRSRAGRHRSIDVQAERLLQHMQSIAVPLEPVYEPPEVPHGEGKRHVHVLLLSDLHAAEVVDAEAMDGLGAYNWEIMVERMARIQKSLRSYQNNRPYPFDELQIWMLGDMNSGGHMDEFRETNQYPEADQCYRTGELLANWIEPLVEDYPTITVNGISGNHPRLRHKPASKQVFNNFDWLSYKFAELRLAKYETVSCNFPRSGYMVANVVGLDYLLWHGDGIRSTMPGVPWGGVMRRTNELRKEYQRAGIDLKGFALGHFHQANAIIGQQLFMNGAVKGIDEYTLKAFGSSDPPTQLLLTFCRDTKRFTDVSVITP